jgi:hypothetical protein
MDLKHMKDLVSEINYVLDLEAMQGRELIFDVGTSTTGLNMAAGNLLYKLVTGV